MTSKKNEVLWIVVAIFIFLSMLYTSYKTLVQKNFIIIEEQEE